MFSPNSPAYLVILTDCKRSISFGAEETVAMKIKSSVRLTLVAATKARHYRQTPKPATTDRPHSQPPMPATVGCNDGTTATTVRQVYMYMMIQFYHTQQHISRIGEDVIYADKS